MIRRRNSLVFDLMGEYKAYFRRRDGTGIGGGYAGIIGAA